MGTYEKTGVWLPDERRYRHECECCGKEILSRRASSVKYCSPKCRKRVSRSGSVTVWHKEWRCHQCGAQFYPKQPGQRPIYCSKACKQKAYRMSKKQDQ